MSGPQSSPPAEEKREQRSSSEKQKEHIRRIIRTLIACFLGMITGYISFVVGGTPDANLIQPNLLLEILILMAGVVVQKHVMVLLRIDPSKLASKDWFYQSFMTFALWFITLTILLTTSVQ
jgi:uncharacterized membrane protein YgaE (UPF0421/DUF939 family)